MKITDIRSYTIGDIVARDFRTATVFREAGIDFCCGGGKTLEETCAEKGIDAGDLMARLEKVESAGGALYHNFNEWSPGFLCEYIVNVHHTYVRKTLPELVHYTRKIADVHGTRHSELKEVADLFTGINNELSSHLKKEEVILFPAIREFFDTGSEIAKITIGRELNLLIGEHESAGSAMDRINAITGGYLLPDDACNTYTLAFRMLSEFEDDLHVHVHLENNILFPKTIEKLN